MDSQFLSGLLAVGLGMILLIIALSFVITALSLFLAGKMVKSERSELMSAIKTIIYWFLLGLAITLLTALLNLYLSSREYETKAK